MSGESAGAVYTHAHLITGPPVKRAVMASGTLFLSSPLPVEKGEGLIKALEAKVGELGQTSLRDSAVTVLIQALKECNVNTMWIQEEPELTGWETRPEQVEEVMIGDVEYEVSKASAFPSPRASLICASVGYLAKWHRAPRWRDNRSYV